MLRFNFPENPDRTHENKLKYTRAQANHSMSSPDFVGEDNYIFKKKR